MISVKHLGFSYRQRNVLRDISFDLKSGEVLSVLGPNGVGKSTLFRCVLNFLQEYTGQVLVDGVDVRTLTQREMAQKIAYIPQVHRPTFGYTVLDTVLMGTARQLNAFALPKDEQVDQAYEALRRIGVKHLAERDFSRLSGGEQQLVLIARAIAQQAGILIMDEPTSALDYGNQLRLLKQVRQLANEGYGVLVSTHNPQHALSFADRMLALVGGEIAALGRPGEVLTAELINRLYDVEVDFAQTRSGPVLLPRAAGGSL